MISRYHRNTIYTGYVDAYCLVCNNHLKTEEDVEIHIGKPIHKKNLASFAYFEKFKDECIRQLKKGYYCEICNLLLPTPVKVELHIAEARHNENKGSQLLKRVGNYVVAFEDVAIDDTAWNGLMDDTCGICDTQFEDEGIHKTQPSHVLNLIQSKIEFGPERSVYRKIDQQFFQCLTCNLVLQMSSMSTHFLKSSHKDRYSECRQLNIDINKNASTVKMDSNEPELLINDAKIAKTKAETKEPEPIEVIKESVDLKKLDQVEVKKPESSEVKKPETANLKKAEPADIKKPEPAGIKKPESADVKKPEPIDVKKTGAVEAGIKKTDMKKSEPVEIKNSDKLPGHLDKATIELDEEICKVLGVKEYIGNDDNDKKWCILCDWTMDPMMINHHVYGRHHQTMLKMHRERMQKKLKSEKTLNSEKEEIRKLIVEPKVDRTDSAEQDKSKILESVDTFQKNDISINFEHSTASCKKCSKTIVFSYESIKSHIEEHTKKHPKEERKPPKFTFEKPVEDKKKSLYSSPVQMRRPSEDKSSTRASSVASSRGVDEEAEKFAKDNNICQRDSKFYCQTCESSVPSSLKSMKEHVKGISHKNKIATRPVDRKPKAKPISKLPMKECIHALIAIENDFMKDVVINERHCVNILSFLMITQNYRLHCEVCDEFLTDDELNRHKETSGHQQAMCETPVIVSMESEFIREVRPDVYHCGYCNHVEEGLEDLEKHLESASHRESKTSANWRVQMYMPQVLQERRQKMEMFFLLQRLGGDMF